MYLVESRIICAFFTSKTISIELNTMNFLHGIERIRGIIGGIIILSSFLFFIPGVTLLVSSDIVYGSAMSGYPITKEIPVDGSVISIDLSMVKGNNYDVKYQLKTIADKTNPNVSSINVFVNSSSLNGQLENLPKGTFSDSNFNESILHGINSFPSKLTSDEVLTMSFHVVSAQNIAKTVIYISLYQNPNRELSSIISTIGIIIILPGIVIFVIGAIIAGNDHKNKRKNNRKVGDRELYIDL